MIKNKRDQRTKQYQQASPRLLAILAAGALLLILGAVFAFSQPSKPKAVIEVIGAPGLKVDKEEVDLGEVKLGQIVQVSFEITNVGDQNLQFTKEPYIEVKEGC